MGVLDSEGVRLRPRPLYVTFAYQNSQVTHTKKRLVSVHSFRDFSLQCLLLLALSLGEPMRCDRGNMEGTRDKIPLDHLLRFPEPLQQPSGAQILSM